jgi:hypothetical protein
MITLFSIFLWTSNTSNAQTLTGIWRGHFSSGRGFWKENYKYEVQLNHFSNQSLKGVTYS